MTTSPTSGPLPEMGAPKGGSQLHALCRKGPGLRSDPKRGSATWEARLGTSTGQHAPSSVGVYFSYQLSKDLNFSIASAPQMHVEKTYAMGNTRVGKWRLVRDHSYPGSAGEGGKLGASNTRTTKFHHPRSYCPTAKHVTRMSLECSAKYPGVGQRGYKHDIETTYNLIDARTSDTKLFGVLLPDSIGDSVWQAVQTTCEFGLKEASGIHYANVALGIDASHGLHNPNDPHINGPDAFRSTAYSDDTMAIEPDLGLRPWLSDVMTARRPVSSSPQEAVPSI